MCKILCQAANLMINRRVTCLLRVFRAYVASLPPFSPVALRQPRPHVAWCVCRWYGQWEATAPRHVCAATPADARSARHTPSRRYAPTVLVTGARPTDVSALPVPLVRALSLRHSVPNTAVPVEPTPKTTVDAAGREAVAARLREVLDVWGTANPLLVGDVTTGILMVLRNEDEVRLRQNLAATHAPTDSQLVIAATGVSGFGTDRARQSPHVSTGASAGVLQ